MKNHLKQGAVVTGGILKTAAKNTAEAAKITAAVTVNAAGSIAAATKKVGSKVKHTFDAKNL